MSQRPIHCCGCQRTVLARLTEGSEVLPERLDTRALPFWVCDGCKNFVGCYRDSSTANVPLGSIPTAELRNARRYLLSLTEPVVRGGLERKAVYALVSKELGRRYYPANVRSMDEAAAAHAAILRVRASVAVVKPGVGSNQGAT